MMLFNKQAELSPPAKEGSQMRQTGRFLSLEICLSICI